MLILTRRLNETVKIGHDISVSVIGVQGSQVRLAFKAPREVVVDREEIAVRKKRDIIPPRTD